MGRISKKRAKMKAVVIVDKYDDPEVKEHLYNELRLFRIEPLEFTNLDEFQKNFSSLSQFEHHLFYPSIYFRYDISEILFAYQQQPEYPTIRYGTYTAAFLPHKTLVSRDSVDCIERYQKLSMQFTKLPELIRPKIKALPRIIIYTHNHDVYFRQTMNSILYSLCSCKEIPITIVANNPTPKVLETAIEFQNKHSTIDVLYCKDNLAFAGMNIGIQWHNPEIVIGAEDDFILPPAAREIYPNWPYQFALRLEHFHRVGWGIEFQNLEYNRMPDWQNPQNVTRLGWHYFDGVNGYSPTLMCQLWMFKKSEWIKCYDKERKCAVDCHFNERSLDKAVPFLRGYHLSWNVQDNLYSLKLQEAAKKPPEKTIVQSLKTKETREIILDDVLRL